MKHYLVELFALGLAFHAAHVSAQVVLQSAPEAALAAEDAPGESAPAVASAPTASAVSVMTIPWRARDMEVQLRVLEGALDSRELDEVKQALPSFFEEMAELNQPGSTSATLSRRRELHDVLISWESLRERLKRWQERAETRTDLLEGYRQMLEGQQQTWTLTRESLDEQDAPAAAVAKTDEILAAIAASRAKLAAGTDRLFEVAERLDYAQRSLDARVELLRRVQERSRRQLISRDGKPLWALFNEAELPGLTGNRSHVRQGLRAFWDTYHGRLPLHLFLLTAGLVGLRLVAARARRRMLAVGQAVPPVLEAPVLCGLLIALIAARFIYDKAAFATLDLLAIISLALLGYLAHYLTPNAVMRRLIRCLVAVLVSYRVCALLDLNDPWFDLASGATALLLLGVQYWAVRLLRASAPTISGPRLRRGVFLFLSAAVVGLSLALLAGVFGFHALLEYLLEGFAISAHWLLLSIALTSFLSAFVAAAFDAGRISKLSSVQRHGGLLRARAQWGLNALGILLWCFVALHSFELFEPSSRWLRQLLAGSVSTGSWSMSLSGVGSFLLTMYLGSKLSQLVGFFLDEDILPRMQLSRGVPPTISRLTRYLIVATSFIFAVGAAGVDMSKVALVASALSVGIGFGLQNVVNNFVSGLIIIFERPVRVGDTIQLGDLLGEVQTIGIRASTIRTAQGAEAILPNADLISNQLINWTLSDPKRRIDLPIGVAYGSNPKRVIELIKEAVEGAEGVAAYPEATCIFVGFGESSLDFELRIWAQRSEEWPLVRSALAVAVCEKLTAEGIEIPFPQRDLHLRSIDAAAAQQLTSELLAKRTPEAKTPPEIAAAEAKAPARSSVSAGS